MAHKEVLLVTGAGRGMGVDIAKAALAAGYAVVATGRNPRKVEQAPEVTPYGIRTMLVKPGFFRTEALSPESVSFAESSIDDYPERSGHIVTAFSGMSGRQGGDPAKLAAALTQLMSSAQPPLRRPAGGDAVSTLEQKAKTLLDQAEAHRDLSSSHHPGT